MTRYTAADCLAARFVRDGEHYRCTKPGRATDGRSYHLGSLYTERQASWLEIQPSPPKSLRQPGLPNVT